MVLDGVVHGEAVQIAFRKVLLARGRQVAEREHRSIEPPTLKEVQYVPHKRPVPQGHKRFGDVVGDRTQPGPLSPNKNDDLHRSRSLHQP